jgi:Rha family phage regulatory protein
MEDNLVTARSEQAVTTSLKVAEVFHKRHANVIRDIEKLLNETAPEFGKLNFELTNYTTEQGHKQKAYWMTEDGFTLLVMGYSGKKAIEFKVAYIREFRKMQALLYEKKTSLWIEQRRSGLLARKEETDVIKQLVEYAKEQGSNHADMLYMIYSKLANKAAGLTTKRELADTVKLNTLSMVENIVIKMIRSGMEKGDDYKKIYQDTKSRLEQFKQVAFLQEGG